MARVKYMKEGTEFEYRAKVIIQQIVSDCKVALGVQGVHQRFAGITFLARVLHPHGSIRQDSV